MTGPRDVLLYDFPGSICCQMTRVTLAEKGVAYATRTVDIVKAREQFEPWYTELNEKAVVPTLVIGEEVICDTMNIVRRVDSEFDGPELTPDGDAAKQAMDAWMEDIMGIHYGVLLYSRSLDGERRSSVIAGRLDMLLELREQKPDAAALLDQRIAGNRKLQATLADEAAVAQHVDGVAELLRRMERALSAAAHLAGEHYSLADAFATAAIARFDLQGFSSWWEHGALPAINAYYDRMQARPSWSEAGVIRA